MRWRTRQCLRRLQVDLDMVATEVITLAEDLAAGEVRLN